MRMLPFLLRLFLFASLVANGVGFSHAAARSQPGSAGATSTVPAAASGGCHDAAPDMTIATPQEHAGTAHGDTPQDMDCCDGEACPGNCLVQAPMAAIAPLLPVAQGRLARGDGLRHAARGHPAPRLAHLMRPPIG